MPALPSFPAFPNQDLWETSLRISRWAAMYLATAHSKSKGNTTCPLRVSPPPTLDLQHLDCMKGPSTMNCDCGNACVLQDSHHRRHGAFMSTPPGFLVEKPRLKYQGPEKERGSKYEVHIYAQSELNRHSHLQKAQKMFRELIYC